jgi:hypothetical protein
MNDVRALLDGLSAGDKFTVHGYTDSEGVVKTITVRKLPENGYRDMQEASLRILESDASPGLPGFPPEVVAEARESLMASIRKSLDGGSPTSSNRGRIEDLVDSPLGGFAYKPEDTSVYVTRLEAVETSVLGGVPKVKNSRPLTLAKEALKEALRLPLRDYIHMLKLEPGKFDRVETVV